MMMTTRNMRVVGPRGCGGNRNRRGAVYEVVMGRSERKDQNWGEWVLPNLYGNKDGGEGMITT